MTPSLSDSPTDLHDRVEPVESPSVNAPDGETSASSLVEWVQENAQFPIPDTEFLGFRIERELGRGAFGRVYLARQGYLAGRLVALKVACDIGGESRALAQLQ